MGDSSNSMGDSNNFTSQISVDAVAWVDDRSQGDHQRSRRDDPSGAIPRTSGASGIQPSTIPNTDQFYTGRGEEQNSKLSIKSLTAILTREEFITKHFDKLSKELKVGFFDVMVLYSENDYIDAEKFRAHLENEIFPEEPGKIKAVLYDGPELEGLAASKLQHLDGGFQRCTFTFVFLTSQFVECDWCNLSSENCLMEAIYNKEKKWCVVPVYTVQRNKADFRIPMGLNSLKGINYYNSDDFYRKGVRRLIGDKIIKREENEIKLHQQRYDYLFKKVLEDIERDSRMQIQHEEKQLMLHQCHVEKERELFRSRSVMEQPRRNVMCPSGSASEFPKTAGESSHPPYFPPEFVSKQPSEGDNMSSMASKLGEANPKYDCQDMQSIPTSMDHGEPQSVTGPPHDSSPSSRHSGQSSIPDEDYTSASNIVADHLRGAGRAPQMTDITGKNEIHIHYYMNERPPEKTINITAENVIIGENAQISADRKNVDVERARHDINTSSREYLSYTEERNNNVQGTSQGTSQGSFMVDGSPIGQSTGIVGNSNPVENDDTERVKCVSQFDPSISKELDTPLKSAVNDSKYVPPSNIPNPGIAPVSSTDVPKHMSSERKPSQPDQPKHTPEQNIPFKINKDQPECDNITKIFSVRHKPGPVKLPSRGRSTQPVAKVQPIKKQSPEWEDVDKGTYEKEKTSVKQTVSHQTEPKGVYTSDSDDTIVKTPPRASSLQQSPGERLDPDDTEVLKPIRGQRNTSKVSDNNLEIDGCSNLSSSTEESSIVLTREDLEIEAVQNCIVMGYTEEQIADALSKLKQSRPGHHHFSLNDLLDTLDTTSDMFDRNNKTAKDEDNWVTLTKDETSGEFCEKEEISFKENNVSKPVGIKKSSTDPNISNSQKSKSPNCRMS